MVAGATTKRIVPTTEVIRPPNIMNGERGWGTALGLSIAAGAFGERKRWRNVVISSMSVYITCLAAPKTGVMT